MSEPEGLSGLGAREQGPRDENLHGEKPRDEGLRRRFDPRFSPAFQPGYDPRVHREAPPSAPLREGSGQDWSLVGTGAQSPAGRASDVRAPAAPARGDAAETLDDFPIFAIPGDPSETAQEEPEPEGAEPAPWWHRINPWLFVLWALGIAILLFAFQFVNMVFDPAFQPNPNDQTGFLVPYLPQLVIFGLPSLVCLGLAVFVTPFVILAARWHRA